jgi:O-antigen/teichoic acid export membrane protein
VSTRLAAAWRRLWASRAARNAAASYFAFVSNAVCGLISIPVTVQYLDKREIGLWAVVNTFVSYLLWLDMGVGDATGRKMAEAIAHEDPGEVNRWWTTSVFVLTIQGILMFLVAVSLSPWIGPSLRLDDQLAGEARVMFLGAVAVSAVGMPVRAYPGILLAQERFHWIPLAQGVMPWIQLVIFASLLQRGLGMRSYLPAVVGSWLAGWTLLVVQAHRGRERFALDPRGLTRERLASLFRYSGSVAINGIAATVMQTLPSLMLARMGGLGTVPAYTFSGAGPGMLRTLTARTSHAFYPNLQRMYVLREYERFAKKYQAVNLLALGMSLVAAGAVLAGNRSLVEWLADADFFAGPLANGWLAVSVILLSLLASFTDLLQISGSMGRIAVLSLLQLAGGVAFTWLGFRWAGLTGLVAAVALVPIAFQGLYSLSRGAANCGLQPRQVAGSSSALAATGCVATIVLSWWLSTLTIETDTVNLLGRTTRLPTLAEWAAGLAIACPGVAVLVSQISRLRRLSSEP